MRRPIFLLLIALAGCAAPDMQPPSLAPRPAEAIDPRAPVAEAPVPSQANPALVQQLETLVAQALAADEAFRSVAGDAERLAASAGPAQSESWIVAQQALSAAVAAREPVTRSLGEIDARTATRIQRQGGMSAADLAAIEAASARVAELDARHAELIERVQARLRG